MKKDKKRTEDKIDSVLKQISEFVIKQKLEELEKSRIYLKPGEKPPEGVEVKRGPKSGIYYEGQPRGERTYEGTPEGGKFETGKAKFEEYWRQNADVEGGWERVTQEMMPERPVKESTVYGERKRGSGELTSYERPLELEVIDEKTKETKTLLYTNSGQIIGDSWKPETIWINRDPMAHIQASGYTKVTRDPKTGELNESIKQYICFWANEPEKDKWSRLANMEEDLTGWVDKISEDIQNESDYSKQTAATILGIMMETGMRVGSQDPEEQKGHKTSYGARSLLKEHVKIKGDKISFSFPGKGGEQYDTTIKSSAIAKVLNERMEGKNGKDPIFQRGGEGTKTFRYKGGVVDYVNELSPGEARYISHDMRTLRACHEAIKVLKNLSLMSADKFIKTYKNEKIKGLEQKKLEKALVGKKVSYSEKDKKTEMANPKNPGALKKLKTLVGTIVGSTLHNTTEKTLKHYIDRTFWVPYQEKLDNPESAKKASKSVKKALKKSSDDVDFFTSLKDMFSRIVISDEYVKIPKKNGKVSNNKKLKKSTERRRDQNKEPLEQVSKQINEFVIKQKIVKLEKDCKVNKQMRTASKREPSRAQLGSIHEEDENKRIKREIDEMDLGTWNANLKDDQFDEDMYSDD